MSISENILQLRQQLPKDIMLIAVSKFHPESALMEAYRAGQRLFGESRVQELAEKQQALPQDIEWHFIGPLQRNKVKQIIPFVHTIQSIDSLKLLEEVNKQAVRIDRTIHVLLEVHIAEEENKHGFHPEEIRAFFRDGLTGTFTNVTVSGLMAMATNTDDPAVVRQEFHGLKQLFDEIRNKDGVDRAAFSTLSMGMTHDYLLAIEEGSTMVRIGTRIFGEREY